MIFLILGGEIVEEGEEEEEVEEKIEEVEKEEVVEFVKGKGYVLFGCFYFVIVFFF